MGSGLKQLSMHNTIIIVLLLLAKILSVCVCVYVYIKPVRKTESIDILISNSQKRKIRLKYLPKVTVWERSRNQI